MNISQVSRPFAHTRDERAERLRDPIRALVEKSSYRQAASITGTTVGAIRSLLDNRTPQESTLVALETWAGIANEREGSAEAVPAITRPEWLDDKTIGQKIHSIRQRLSWSQQQLAEHLGMDNGQAEVSRWERGKRRPAYETLAAIAGLVGEDVGIFQVAPTAPARSPAWRSRAASW